MSKARIDPKLEIDDISRLLAFIDHQCHRRRSNVMFSSPLETDELRYWQNKDEISDSDLESHSLTQFIDTDEIPLIIGQFRSKDTFKLACDQLRAKAICLQKVISLAEAKFGNKIPLALKAQIKRAAKIMLIAINELHAVADQCPSVTVDHHDNSLNFWKDISAEDKAFLEELSQRFHDFFKEHRNTTTTLTYFYYIAAPSSAPHNLRSTQEQQQRILQDAEVAAGGEVKAAGKDIHFTTLTDEQQNVSPRQSYDDPDPVQNFHERDGSPPQEEESEEAKAVDTEGEYDNLRKERREFLKLKAASRTKQIALIKAIEADEDASPELKKAVYCLVFEEIERERSVFGISFIKYKRSSLQRVVANRFLKLEREQAHGAEESKGETSAPEITAADNAPDHLREFVADKKNLVPLYHDLEIWLNNIQPGVALDDTQSGISGVSADSQGNGVVDENDQDPLLNPQGREILDQYDHIKLLKGFRNHVNQGKRTRFLSGQFMGAGIFGGMWGSWYRTNLDPIVQMFDDVNLTIRSTEELDKIFDASHGEHFHIERGNNSTKKAQKRARQQKLLILSAIIVAKNKLSRENFDRYDGYFDQMLAALKFMDYNQNPPAQIMHLNDLPTFSQDSYLKLANKLVSGIINVEEVDATEINTASIFSRGQGQGNESHVGICDTDYDLLLLDKNPVISSSDPSINRDPNL